MQGGGLPKKKNIANDTSKILEELDTLSEKDELIESSSDSTDESDQESDQPQPKLNEIKARGSMRKEDRRFEVEQHTFLKKKGIETSDKKGPEGKTPIVEGLSKSCQEETFVNEIIKEKLSETSHFVVDLKEDESFEEEEELERNKTISEVLYEPDQIKDTQQKSKEGILLIDPVFPRTQEQVGQKDSITNVTSVNRHLSNYDNDRKILEEEGGLDGNETDSDILIKRSRKQNKDYNKLRREGV